MKSFLDKVADNVLSKNQYDPQRLFVIFPNRRACTWFKDRLSQKIDGPVWSPRILAIEDLISMLSGLEVIDPVSLSFEFFPIYQKLIPNVPFEKYYAWAGQLIADFDEIDRHMANAAAIYKNLYELKAIDETVESWLPDESEDAPLRRQFMAFWEKMGLMYAGLRAKLLESKQAFGGMALRQVAEELDVKAELPFDHIVFAGFNALSKAEEVIVTNLLEAGLAEFLTDMDRWYVDDPVQEAGKFFRSYRKNWDPKYLNPPEDFFGSIPKTIRLSGTPKRVSQAKFAGLSLAEIMKSNPDPRETAVVLGDENLLFPMLESIPSEVPEINVTMGYPLRHTSMYGLFDSLISLHENAEKYGSKRKGRIMYYHRDVTRILSHSLIRKTIPKKSWEWLRKMKRENWVYVDPKHLVEDQLGFLFQPWSEVNQIIEMLIGLCEYIRKESEEENKLGQLEGEFLFQYYRLVRKLRTKIETHSISFGIATFRRVFREMIRQVSVPFSGEPLAGVQLMGILETRVLDFKNLIILSVNEGIIPPAKNTGSFIPYGMRKAFDLPTQEDRDAVIAYHFFRLLHRAENVQLIYNTEPGKLGTGEKSRFIHQIELELAAKYDHIKVIPEVLTFPSGPTLKPPIIVNKTGEIQETIDQFLAENGLSASALINWINCPLRFYYQHVLRIEERDEIEENLQADTFGQVMHLALEKLYAPFKGSEVTAEGIESSRPQIPGIVEKAFKDVAGAANIQFGKNQLLFRVICSLSENFLDEEMKSAPFQVIGLEEKLVHEFERGDKKVKVKGVIDRIDEQGGRRRIIDYKTGAVNYLSYKDWADVIKNPKTKKESFQLAVYSWLYFAANPEAKETKSGVIWFKALSKGLTEMSLGNRSDSISREDIAGFEKFLFGIIDDILDPSQPIIQTEDEQRCNYCNFASICGRN